MAALGTECAATFPDAVHVAITAQADVEQARREARLMARVHGGNVIQAEELALAVSELATNVLRHAGAGRVTLSPVEQDGRRGIGVECSDQGPGIRDIPRALADGFSTTASLGSGLPMARRLTDGFRVDSSPAGTRVVAIKWLAPA